MNRSYKLTIPTTKSELRDLLGSMMLLSPAFEDKTGYFPGMNIDTTFEELSGGIENIKAELDPASYSRMLVLVEAMRRHFEAGNVREGNIIIDELQSLLDNRL